MGWCEPPMGTPDSGPPALGATLVFFQNIPHFLKKIVVYVFDLNSAGPLLLHGLFSGWGECGLLTAVAPRCGAQALGARASAVAAPGSRHRLSSCGSRAQLL